MSRKGKPEDLLMEGGCDTSFHRQHMPPKTDLSLSFHKGFNLCACSLTCSSWSASNAVQTWTTWSCKNLHTQEK